MRKEVHIDTYRATLEDELCTRMLDSTKMVRENGDSLFGAEPISAGESSGDAKHLPTEPLVSVIDPPRFSFYKKPIRNTTPCREITLTDLFSMVTSDSAKASTERLRGIADKELARDFKKQNFDYVTPAGTFTKRDESALVCPSGLMVIDIDGLRSPEDVEDTFQLLMGNPRLETELLFRSPGGLGLKWFIPIVNNTGHDHRYYFQAVSNYLKSFGVVVDPSGKDVSRACFIPWDPNAFINPKYLKDDNKQ